MGLSAAKRGQLILLIVGVSGGGAGYCLGRFQTASIAKAAAGTGDGTAAVNDSSMTSARARELYGRGDYAAAAVEAKRVLLLNPSDAGAYAVMKLAKAKLGGVIAPDPFIPTEEHARAAQKHWNRGIIFFQAGQYAKARDEWLLCKQFEPANADCQTGLQRIDTTYGGGS